MKEVGGGRPADGGTGGDGGGELRVIVRLGGQFANQSGNPPGFGAWGNPVGGTGSEGEPIGLGSPDDDVVDDVLKLPEQRIR